MMQSLGSKEPRPATDTSKPELLLTILLTDSVLVSRSLEGESWATEALFRRHARMANGLAFRLMGRDSDVDDLVQDAFVEALSSLHRLQNRQAFSAWLGSIVCRTAFKRLRRRKLLTRLGLRGPSEGALDGAMSPSVPPDVAAEGRHLYRALDRLPEIARVVFLLRRIEGMTVEEVADRLRVSPKTVKRRFADAEAYVAELRRGT